MNIINCSFNFTVEGHPFKIVVAGEVPNLVHTYKYRPLERYKTNLMTVYNKIEASEFAEDVQFLLQKLESPVPSGTDLAQYALTDICKKHISKYSRLVISDLHTFLDEMLIIYEHIEQAQGKPMSMEEGYQIWESYHDILTQIFQQYIWIPSPLNPNQLIKLT